MRASAMTVLARSTLRIRQMRRRLTASTATVPRGSAGVVAADMADGALVLPRILHMRIAVHAGCDGARRCGAAVGGGWDVAVVGLGRVT